MTEARPSRSTSGRFARSLDTAQRDSEAARLKKLGASWQEIAAQLGYKTTSGAWRAAERAIKSAPVENGAALRQLEVEKLDSIERLMWATMRKEHRLAQNGRIVLDPYTQEPLADLGPIFAAADKLLRVADRRSKLLNLDAPLKIESKALGERDTEIRALIDALIERAKREALAEIEGEQPAIEPEDGGE